MCDIIHCKCCKSMTQTEFFVSHGFIVLSTLKQTLVSGNILFSPIIQNKVEPHKLNVKEPPVTAISVCLCVCFSVGVNIRRATGCPGPEVCLLSAALHLPACALIRWVRTLIRAPNSFSVFVCTFIFLLSHTRNQKTAKTDLMGIFFLSVV